jgi:hypothetical protein
MGRPEIRAVAIRAAILVRNGKTSSRFKYGLPFSIGRGELARTMAGRAAADRPSPHESV